MATRMLQRRGTAAEWAAANPVLGNGEIGIATDTEDFKIGDGVTAWNSITVVYRPASAFLTTSGKAADSELLDGLDSTAFVRASNGVAYDSARLGGVLASSYALKTDGVNPNSPVTFTDTVTFGDADTDVTLQRAAVVETHTRNTTNTYTNGLLTQVVEKAGATTVRTITLNYTNGALTSTVEVAGGKTITTTLTYSGDVLTGTTRTVA